MSTTPCLSQLFAALGESRPVGTLFDSENADPSVLAQLEARGLREFRVDTRSTPELCVSALLGTLDGSGWLPGDIDAIVVGHSTSPWDLEQEMELFRLLGRAGFERTRLIGIALQECAAAAQALQAAKDLVSRKQAARVLVVVAGRLAQGSRIAPGGTTLFSDGAVACLVSTDRTGFEIVATETLTAPSLARLEWSEANSRRYFESGSGLVRDVAAKVCAEADIGADRISVVFGTNSNVFCLQMTGLAAGLSSSRVYQRNLARHAHVFGCDALLGLKTYCEETEFPQQGFALMIGWAPYVASACLLRRV